MSATTILLYGPSASGKTPQLGLLAEDVFVRTGKKTRIYSGDFGGTDTIDPYVDLDIIELVEIGSTNPWIFVNMMKEGRIRDDKGKWVKDEKRNANIGMYGFESAHGLAQLLKLDMEQKAAFGTAIGGDTNTSFDVAGDGEKLKIGTTKGYQKFALPQIEILRAMYDSFKLPVEYIVWTAGIERGDDDVLISTSKVIGPDVIGRALTGILNKDFNYTMRMSVIAAKDGKQERHLLHLGTHAEGNATALGNIRRPLDAPELKQLVVEPANIVTALKMVKEDAKRAAKEAIQKRLTASKNTTVKSL